MKGTKLTAQRQSPLKWPEGWERTRIKDRKAQASWKKTRLQYEQALVTELERLGATEVLITCNAAEQQDPGVAVYFSRNPSNQFEWQDALGIENPAPTVAEIDSAFRAKAMKYHPDRPDGDAKVFDFYVQHRKAAVAWIKGEHTAEHEFSIPCDRFTEVRLNLAAIRLAVSALRQLERVGVPAILERSFRGFRTALPMHATEIDNAASA